MWNDYPDHTLADSICTPKELQVLHLKHAGYGQRRTARILGISREATRYRLHSALDKIERHKHTGAA